MTGPPVLYGTFVAHKADTNSGHYGNKMAEIRAEVINWIIVIIEITVN